VLVARPVEQNVDRKLMNQNLLSVLIDTEDKRRAYLTNARFHYMIDALVTLLPQVVEGASLLADHETASLEKQIDLLGRQMGIDPELLETFHRQRREQGL